MRYIIYRNEWYSSRHNVSSEFLAALRDHEQLRPHGFIPANKTSSTGPSAPVALSFRQVGNTEQVAVVNVMAVYLCPEPLAEASGYHAPGVGLQGQHGSQAPPKCLPDQEAAATSLDESYVEAGLAVTKVVFPRPVDGLKTQEAGLHLKQRRVFEGGGDKRDFRRLWNV